jgi:cytochrome P450
LLYSVKNICANLLCSNLGSDTTAVTLCGFWFYITRRPLCYEKLINEIRSTFPSVEDIHTGPRLASCTYLMACVHESLRLGVVGAGTLDRVVLRGGININGNYFPEGTSVACSGWTKMHNEKCLDGAYVFRPERWIADTGHGVTQEDVARAHSGFNPFSSGPGNCPGQKLAMVELQLVIARTLYRADVRLSPGDTTGAGGPEKMWGMRDPDHFQVRDAYVILRDGPVVQFRRREGSCN